MSAHVDPRREFPRRAWGTEGARLVSVCALLVLAGLLGMHGLPDHGMATGNGRPNPGPVPSRVVAGHGVAHDRVSGGADGSARVSLDGTAHHGDMGNMAGLCLAILAGPMLGLAGWLSSHRRRPLFDKPLHAMCVVRPRGRDPDPPLLTFLSVFRC